MTDQDRTKFKVVYPVRHRTTAEEIVREAMRDHLVRAQKAQQLE